MRNYNLKNAQAKRNEIHVTNINQYNLNPSKCKNCGKILLYKQRHNIFCSHPCAAAHNNIGVRRHGKERSKCVICGKLLGNSNRTTCNTPFCKVTQNIKQYGDLSHQPYHRNKTIKHYYIIIRGHKCERCGTTTWLNQPVPLIGHHINGDANDWSPENVQILCGNCHPFTPNYCGKNVGNSTRFRRYNIL